MVIKMDEMQLSFEDRKTRWNCRRGMLELDFFLMTFFDKRYLTLSPEQQQNFHALQECTEQDLFVWLMGTEEPPHEFKSLVNDIRRTAGNQS